MEKAVQCLNEDWKKHWWKASTPLTSEPRCQWSLFASSHLFVSKLHLHYETVFLWELLPLQNRWPVKCVVPFPPGWDGKEGMVLHPTGEAELQSHLKMNQCRNVCFIYTCPCFTHHHLPKTVCKLAWDCNCLKRHLPVPLSTCFHAWSVKKKCCCEFKNIDEPFRHLTSTLTLQ